jgi:hypothetical protein
MYSPLFVASMTARFARQLRSRAAGDFPQTQGV